MGLLTDADGAVINVDRYGYGKNFIPEHVTIIGVFGASMNAGKTTAAVSLAHGLSRAGFAVAGVKATGTGLFGDFNAFEDAGIRALDFADAGMASTYRMPLERIERGFRKLVGEAAHAGAEIVVVEIADGVFQYETAALLKNSMIRDRLDGLLLAAPDALGSVDGVEALRRQGLRPLAVSGLVTRSPLAVREAVAATGIRHVSREQLCDADAVVSVVEGVLRRPRASGMLAA